MARKQYEGLLIQVPGHSVQIENENNIERLRRTGHSAMITGRPGTTNWFHYGIPVSLSRQRVFPGDTSFTMTNSVTRLSRVEIDWELGNGTLVSRVRVRDGNRIIMTRDGPFGPGGAYPETADLGKPGSPLVRQGIGISIRAQFPVSTSGSGWFRIRYVRVHLAEELSWYGSYPW